MYLERNMEERTKSESRETVEITESSQIILWV